jgi:hypothetical protein
VQQLLLEAERLPANAVGRARSISWVKPPDHLADLVPRVRCVHGGALAQLHAAVDQRLVGQLVGSERGAFYAASELALIEFAWRAELLVRDRSALRAPWEHLLCA